MTNQAIVPTDKRYEVHEWRNGLAILSAAHPKEWSDILAVLKRFRLRRSDIMKPGGAKGLISSALDSHFTKLGWIEKKFDTRIVVDKSEFVTPTRARNARPNTRSARSPTRANALAFPLPIGERVGVRGFGILDRADPPHPALRADLSPQGRGEEVALIAS